MPNDVKIGRVRVSETKTTNYIEIDGVRIAGLVDFTVQDSNTKHPSIMLTFVPEMLTIDNTNPPPLTPPDPEPETPETPGTGETPGTVEPPEPEPET